MVRVGGGWMEEGEEEEEGARKACVCVLCVWRVRGGGG